MEATHIGPLSLKSMLNSEGLSDAVISKCFSLGVGEGGESLVRSKRERKNPIDSYMR